jgi:predicted nucleotidyltransferase component of viral defense system
LIPRTAITAWRAVAPWKTNEQVEQDLIICRALVALYSDEAIRKQLAFRGGTALYKLYLTPPARYSEDIDLIQIQSGAIGPLFDRIKASLSFLGEPKRKQKERNNVLVFRFESEIPPVVPMRLKIEINCREHLVMYGIQHVPFQVENTWFKGKANLTTFTLEELLGSKLRALYQRKQGRDLFDLWYALTSHQVELDKVIHAFYEFMKSDELSVSRSDFEENLAEKIQDPNFLRDTQALLRPDINYNIHDAYEIVSQSLISKLD